MIMGNKFLIALILLISTGKSNGQQGFYRAMDIKLLSLGYSAVFQLSGAGFRIRGQGPFLFRAGVKY
ncbi:hypothetical protein DBR40_03855 [Pedobacter sp. KBW01]|nr:hypothetical protein DBR40_03855 [Pedobacter sp. KBW01]